MDPPERPLWIGDAATVILDQWDHRCDYAEQQAAIEQKKDAAAYIMLGKIEQAIAHAYQQAEK